MLIRSDASQTALNFLMRAESKQKSHVLTASASLCKAPGLGRTSLGIILINSKRGWHLLQQHIEAAKGFKFAS